MRRCSAVMRRCSRAAIAAMAAAVARVPAQMVSRLPKCCARACMMSTTEIQRSPSEDYAKLGDGATACLTCEHQACLNACPYGIPIPDFTTDAARRLG